MPIKKPSGQSKDIVSTISTQGIDIVNDKAADEFINRVNDKPKRKIKTQIMMRIDPDLLDRIDQQAGKEGLTRSAWISRTCIMALDVGN